MLCFLLSICLIPIDSSCDAGRINLNNIILARSVTHASLIDGNNNILHCRHINCYHIGLITLTGMHNGPWTIGREHECINTTFHCSIFTPKFHAYGICRVSLASYGLLGVRLTVPLNQTLEFP